MQIATRLPRVTAEPITAEAFAPFGEVFTCPAEGGRHDPQLMLENGRPLSQNFVVLTP